ncbi:N-6 DNA methylase [Nonomuraea sp. CA-143628]|uniref:N-6 DNA methylase n=1 Tax=Nonomuraea sp. CA-143628 TaxID=3239997 RepID=UPI003D8D7EFC
MSAPDGYLSRSEIARLARVRRPAVSNWERRHESYPQPVRVGGEDFFASSAIMEWLDQRVVPRNALLRGERAGTTYGERFRRNLSASSGDESPAVPTTPRPDSVPDAGEVLWKTFDRLRGVQDVAGYRNLVLSLIYLRARDDEGWSAVTKGLVGEIDWAHAAMDRFLPELGSVPALSHVRSRELTALVESADQAVRAFGGAEAFRILLAWFAGLEGIRGGEFYTPDSVARALVEALAPDASADIYDPSCGTGDILRVAAAHLWRTSGRQNFSMRGDTLTAEARALARMNMTLHGIDAQVETQPIQVLCDEIPPRERYSYVIANPPFNMSDWCDNDPADHKGWSYGPPPPSNANFAWLQHVLDHLAPGGRAAVLMPNSAAFSENPRERAIREALVKDGCVEALVALPSKLFYTTTIGVTMWLLAHPDRPRPEILFVDASEMGHPVARNRRTLSEADHKALNDVLSAWRAGGLPTALTPLAAAVPFSEVREQKFNLNPRRYVGPAPVDAPWGGQTIQALRRRLDRLHAQASAADANADQELERLIWPDL